MEAASIQTISDGIMTKDLVSLVEPGFKAQAVTSEEFLDSINERLVKLIA